MDGQDQREVQIREPVPPENWYSNVSLQEAKSFIRSNLEGAARSFIAIGYYLKQIRDRELFREEGFETVWDFAMEEYGISKSTASRYMKMNDRFSKDGNSPEIQERYQGFGKSQLQEMLSLDEEQLEQVTPADRVEDIRAMKKPREIEPEERMAQEVPLLHVGLPEEKQKGSCTVTIGELIGAGEEAGQAVAISQQGGEAEETAEALSAYGTPKRVYPPGSLIAMEGCEGGHDCFSCAMECGIRGKERYCREAPLGKPFPCEVVRCGFAELGEQCQFVNHDLAEHTAGSHEADPCCKNCKEPCEYICSRAMGALGRAEAGTETAGEPGEMDEAEDWEEAEPQEERKPELPDPAMEVDIESYQMSGESQHVFLPPGDVVIICNILHEYAAYLTELAEQAETGFPQMRQRLHAERCKRIQEKIETAIGYSTAEALERCRRKKPSKRDDVGEDAFVLALRKRDRGEKEGTVGADKE